MRRENGVCIVRKHTEKGHLVVTKYTEDKAEANFTFGLYSTTSDGKVYDTFDDKITTYIQGSGYGKASWTELPFWTEDGKELIYVLTEKMHLTGM